MAYKDKADQAAAARRHYEANKEKMKARAVEHRKNQTVVIKDYITEVKSVLCMDCQSFQPGYNLHFDHISDNKLFNIADKVNKGLSLKTIVSEIEKCQVVCANCHGHRTHARRVGDKMNRRKRTQTPIWCDGVPGQNNGHWLRVYTFKDAEMVWNRDHCSECLTEMGVKH